MNPESYQLSPDQIFTLMLIMLGPFRFIGPFSLVANNIPAEKRKSIAIKSGLVAYLALVIGGFLGSKILQSWAVPTDVLILAAGALFLFVALKKLLGKSSSEASNHNATPKEIAFHEIISHYGMATIIVLISSSHDSAHTLMILGVLLLVMLINILVMLFVKAKDHLDPGIFSKAIMMVMGTLQFALSIKIILSALKNLGILKLI